MELRDLGLDPLERAPRPKLIDPFLEKIEDGRLGVTENKNMSTGFTGHGAAPRPVGASLLVRA